MSAVSSTFRAHYSMHAKECAISLSLKMCPSNQGSLAISCRSGTQSDPCISARRNQTGVGCTRPRHSCEYARLCPGQQSRETVPHALMQDVRQNACHNADGNDCERVIRGSN